MNADSVDYLIDVDKGQRKQIDKLSIKVARK